MSRVGSISLYSGDKYLTLSREVSPLSKPLGGGGGISSIGMAGFSSLSGSFEGSGGGFIRRCSFLVGFGLLFFFLFAGFSAGGNKICSGFHSPLVFILLDGMVEVCGVAGYGIRSPWFLGSMISFGGLRSWWVLLLWLPCHGSRISSQVDGGGDDTCSDDGLVGYFSLQFGLKARVSFWACWSLVILGLGLVFIFSFWVLFVFFYFSVMVFCCDGKILFRLEGSSTPTALLSRPIVKRMKKPPRVLIEGATASSV